jgi:hypothetical protein
LPFAFEPFHPKKFIRKTVETGDPPDGMFVKPSYSHTKRPRAPILDRDNHSQAKQEDKMTEADDLLRALCDDEISSRALLGNTSFRKIMSVFGDQLQSRDELIAYLYGDRDEDWPGRPMTLRELPNRETMRRQLDDDFRWIEFLYLAAHRGISPCNNYGSNNDRGADRRITVQEWNSDKANLIVNGTQDSKAATQEVKRWLAGAQKLIICDPYILKFQVRAKTNLALFPTVTAYVEYIDGLVPASVKHLKMFSCGFEKPIKTALRRKLKEGRMLEIFDTNEIHDRYIIRDDKEGLMIGTSFGGFGSKIFTVLPLPAADTAKILSCLHGIEKA